MGAFNPFSKRVVSLIMTLLAGRLIPAASVGVATMHLMFPRLNPLSTNLRCLMVSPALWNAMPLRMQDASFFAMDVDSDSCSSTARSSSAMAGAPILFMYGEYLTARASVDLREFTNTRHWPPIRIVCFMSDHTSSPSTGTSTLVRSSNVISPSM